MKFMEQFNKTMKTSKSSKTDLKVENNDTKSIYLVILLNINILLEEAIRTTTSNNKT